MTHFFWIQYLAICLENCNGHGTCTLPNVCACSSSWNGPNCEFSVGPIPQLLASGSTTTWMSITSINLSSFGFTFQLSRLVLFLVTSLGSVALGIALFVSCYIFRKKVSKINSNPPAPLPEAPMTPPIIPPVTSDTFLLLLTKLTFFEKEYSTRYSVENSVKLE